MITCYRSQDYLRHSSVTAGGPSDAEDGTTMSPAAGPSRPKTRSELCFSVLYHYWPWSACTSSFLTPYPPGPRHTVPYPFTSLDQTSAPISSAVDDV
nr:hypothetical protein CFP56_52466 [Quercus suber]